MPPNLRYVVTQGWKSTGSRRNFSSSHGSKGETRSLYEALKSSVVPSFKTFRFQTWAIYGYVSYGCFELYQCLKNVPEWDQISDYNLEDSKRSHTEIFK